MKPEPTTLLNQIAGKLLFEMAPALPAGYGQGSVHTMALLLILAAQEVPRAAHLRVLENQEMRAIFASSAGLSLEEPLKTQLAEVAKSKTGSLLMPVLEAENSQLKALLIRLHEKVDGINDAKARAINAEILDHLVLSTERRLVVLPVM